VSVTGPSLFEAVKDIQWPSGAVPAFTGGGWLSLRLRPMRPGWALLTREVDDVERRWFLRGFTYPKASA
jgi:hypothetical protein